MKAEFRATTPADAGAIAAFLGRVFEAREGEPIIDPGMMQWKYWRERPGWQGSRSFVLERGGSIVAHGAAWPARILSAEEIPCFFLIDWAASSDFPGAGVSIMTQYGEAGIPPVNFRVAAILRSLARCVSRWAIGQAMMSTVPARSSALYGEMPRVAAELESNSQPCEKSVWNCRKPVPPSKWQRPAGRPLEISRSSIPWPIRNNCRLMWGEI